MTLSTTWTNQSVVAFNAGTMTDISSCVSYVEGKLRRGTLSTSTTPSTTQVQYELIRAKEELCEQFGFTWQRKYAYADTSSSTYRYALPADYNGGEVRLRDMTNDVFLEWVDPYRFDLKYPDVSAEDSGEPLCFTIKDRELWITPPAGSTYRLELEYGRSGDDTTATDVSYLPEVLRFKICDFAVYQCFRILHMWDAAALYKQDWMEGLIRSKRQDSKKKWAHSGFQCLTWQQAYTARGYQGH